MTSSNENIFPCYWPFVRGRSPVNSPHKGQWPWVTRSFDVFSDLRLSKRLSKQSRHWWFETPSRPLWRHCNETHGDLEKVVNVLQIWQTLKDINMLEYIYIYGHVHIKCLYLKYLMPVFESYLHVYHICTLFLYFVHCDISCVITGLLSLLSWFLFKYMWNSFHKVHFAHFMNCITTWYDIHVWTR